MAKSEEKATLADLKQDTHNPRKHTPRNIGVIEASLRQVGAARSGVIDENNSILAGNGTYEALAAAGINKVKIVEADGEEWVVVRRKGLTAEQKRALAIADNRAAELAEWDGPILQTQGIDLAPWFFERELQKIGAQLVQDGGSAPDPRLDKAEELKTRYSVGVGQIWQLGVHTLICGDSFVRETFLGLADQPNLLITSPPYNQKIDQFSPSGMHRLGSWVKKVRRIAYQDSLPEDEYQEKQRSALQIWYEFLADGASVFYNHKNRYRDKHVISPLQWLPGPFKLRQEIVWARTGSVTQNASMFLPCDERIYWLYKGSGFYFNDTTEIKNWSSVWKINFENNPNHPVGYPSEIPIRCIHACSKPEQIVLDPFLGSGTTLVACEQLNRRCYGIEISPQFVAVSIQRWVDLTGKEPKLLNG